MIEAADRAGLFIDGAIGVTPARATAESAKIFLIATEESGDRLGASLMKVLRSALATRSGSRASAGARWRAKA